jgi:hypothetical protein
VWFALDYGLPMGGPFAVKEVSNSIECNNIGVKGIGKN